MVCTMTIAPTSLRNIKAMENNCKNLYDGRLCYLTFHERNRNLIGYPCVYPYNYIECKDYKKKECNG